MSISPNVQDVRDAIMQLHKEFAEYGKCGLCPLGGDSVCFPNCAIYREATKQLDNLFEQFDALHKAAVAYLEHTEDQDFRRGHSNTSCPPLTRAMCTEYMQLRAVLYPASEPEPPTVLPDPDIDLSTGQTIKGGRHASNQGSERHEEAFVLAAQYDMEAIALAIDYLSLQEQLQSAEQRAIEWEATAGAEAQGLSEWFEEAERLKEQLEAVAKERDHYRWHWDKTEEQLEASQKALAQAVAVAIWLTGLPCLNPESEAWPYWESDARPRLYKAMALLDSNPARDSDA